MAWINVTFMYDTVESRKEEFPEPDVMGELEIAIMDSVDPKWYMRELLEHLNKKIKSDDFVEESCFSD